MENEEKLEEEVLDFNKPDFTFAPKEYHEWRQQGPFLVCKSCEIEHATYVGIRRILKGLNEEGQPILIDRDMK